MKFNVSADLIVPVLYEIEAENSEEAEDKFLQIEPSKLLNFANTENSAIEVRIDGISAGDE